jgi:hypothetical protein
VLIRARGLVIGLCIVAGFVALITLAATASPGPGGARAVAGVGGVALAAGVVRLTSVGLRLEPQQVVVRDLLATYRLPRAEVLGLALQPAPSTRLRYRRIAVVCTDGRVIPAAWTIASTSDVDWAHRAAWAGAGFGPTQAEVAPRLEAEQRLTTTEALPVASPDPGLTPATVAPVEDPMHSGRWLGWEMVFVITAFALPAIAGAASILAEHVGGVSDLNEFDLPLPHHPGVSLFLLLLGYSTTALVVPIALLLLARTGQPPAMLGLTRTGLKRDATNVLGLYAGVWVFNLLLALVFLPVINNKHLTNTASNSHVPAYYIVYAVFLSATTAINEEVLVNGYFLTRLSQRGWSPWRALALSLTVRTSYHAYYGVGLLLTVPLGYIATRSFQKRQRLARPILLHFLNDVILLIVAVLTS